MVIKNVNLETVCGITSKINRCQEPAPSRERRRPLIFIISITNVILWICRGMAIRRRM